MFYVLFAVYILAFDFSFNFSFCSLSLVKIIQFFLMTKMWKTRHSPRIAVLFWRTATCFTFLVATIEGVSRFMGGGGWYNTNILQKSQLTSRNGISRKEVVAFEVSQQFCLGAASGFLLQSIFLSNQLPRLSSVDLKISKWVGFQ